MFASLDLIRNTPPPPGVKIEIQEHHRLVISQDLSYHCVYYAMTFPSMPLIFNHQYLTGGGGGGGYMHISYCFDYVNKINKADCQ